MPQCAEPSSAISVLDQSSQPHGYDQVTYMCGGLCPKTKPLWLIQTQLRRVRSSEKHVEVPHQSEVGLGSSFVSFVRRCVRSSGRLEVGPKHPGRPAPFPLLA